MTNSVWKKVKKKYEKEKPKNLKIHEGWSYHSYNYITLDKQYAFIKDYLIFYYKNKHNKQIELKKIHYKKILEIYAA